MGGVADRVSARFTKPHFNPSPAVIFYLLFTFMGHNHRYSIVLVNDSYAVNSFQCISHIHVCCNCSKRHEMKINKD